MITRIIQYLKTIKQEITSIISTEKDIFMSAIDGDNRKFQELRKKQADSEANSSFISKIFVFFYRKLEKPDFIQASTTNIEHKIIVDPDVVRAIENACKRKHHHDIAIYLFSLFSNNFISQDLDFLLYVASKYGNVTFIEQLVKAGADLNKAGTDGFTPAHVAAKYGHANVIAVLANAGADLNKVNARNCAEYITEIHKHANVINVTFIEQPANDGADGFTPVHVAAKHGHATVIAELANAGADLNKAGTFGCTPALIAAKHGHAAVIAELANAGADLNKVNASYYTPAHIAARHGQAAVMAELAKAGADLNKVNASYYTPAYIAAEHGHAAVIAELAKASADLNKAGIYGFTPAHIAAAYGQAAVIAELAKSGANLNKAGTDGFTPAHIAARHGQAAVIAELAKSGADLNKAGIYGFTPAYIAADHGHTTVIATLAVAKGVILNTDHLLMAYKWAINYDDRLLSIHCLTEIKKKLELASSSTILGVKKEISACETKCKKMHHAFMTNMSVCVKKNMPQEIFRNILSFVSGSYESLPATSMKSINKSITMVYNAIDKRSKDAKKVPLRVKQRRT